MIEVLGAAIGHAAGMTGCEKAPYVIRDSDYLAACGFDLNWHIIDDDAPNKGSVQAVSAFSQKLCNAVQGRMSIKKPFVSFGGDHSSAIGLWSGVSNAASGDIGLIWIDAHMDAHTFDTSPTENIHGMPVAVLLGHGDERLTDIGNGPFPKLKPEYLVQMGVRSYEPGEEALLKSLNVRIFHMEEILDRGFGVCFQEARKIVSKAPGGFGLTVDLDGFDVCDAPAVGTPVQNGIRTEDFYPCVQGLANAPKFLALEVVEFNPSLSTGAGITEKAAVDVFASVFGGVS